MRSNTQVPVSWLLVARSRPQHENDLVRGGGNATAGVRDLARHLNKWADGVTNYVRVHGYSGEFF